MGKLYKTFSGKGGLTARWSRSGLPGSRVAAVANKALSIASKVASVLNVEQKNIDTVDAGDFSVSNVKTYLLNGISQGDTGNTRDGDQVKIMKTYGKIQLISTLNGSQSHFRIMLVLDKQADGTTPTISEVLDVGNSEPPTIAHFNMDNKFRFRVLKDKLVKITPQSITGGDGSRIISYFHNFIKHRKNKLKRNPLKEGVRVRYSGTGNTASDIASGSLWLFVIADAALSDFTCDHVGRTRYVDN